MQMGWVQKDWVTFDDVEDEVEDSTSTENENTFKCIH